MNCSSMAAFHTVQSFRNRLLQHKLSTGCSSHQKTCSCMGSSSRATSPARSLLQCRLSTGFLQASLPALVWDPPRGSMLTSALTWSSKGCRGTACFTTVFTLDSSGILAPAPRAPLLAPSSLTFMSTELFLSHVSYSVVFALS